MNKIARTNFLIFLKIVAFWTLPALFYTTQLHIRFDSKARFTWLQTFWAHWIGWFPWMILTPLIFWLGKRFRIERGRLKNAGWHLVFGLLSGVVVMAYLATQLAIGSVPENESLSFACILNETQRMLLDFRFLNHNLLYWAVLGGYYAFDYYRKYKERELRAAELKAELAQAQVQALKMQLHPHFMFNTMNSISALVRNNQNKGAVKMLARLSDLLRYTLDNINTQFVALKEEIEFVERYLEIQQIRYEDRLKVEMNVKPETLKAQVPNLILQPIIENAIKHGVAPQSSLSTIKISAFCENNRLILRIADNGPGLAASRIAKRDEGIGLKNIRARLSKVYGNSYDFKLYNGQNAGVIVDLSIPFKIHHEK